MKIAIAGLGLIGGSFFKALSQTEHEVTGFDVGDEVDVHDAGIVIVALHPRTAIDWIQLHAGEFMEGAIVLDTCGIKGPVMAAVAQIAAGAKWRFCGGHPMAGKEVSGFRNSDATLFRSATMILVPGEGIDDDALATLNALSLDAGFRRTLVADAAHHDEMIAYTSQLCHVISSCYLRDELAAAHDGFSAGSFRDMIRVGAPDPALWSQLFIDNQEALLPVLDRMIGRLAAMRASIAASDLEALSAQLSEGRAIKLKIDTGGNRWVSGKKTQKQVAGASEAKKIAKPFDMVRKAKSASGDEWTVPKEN